MRYAYFVISPGSEVGSYTTYPDGVSGNFIKIGDTSKNTPLGVRIGYKTHNPDFGVAAVFQNEVTLGSRVGLGTRIKKDIVDDGFQLVPGTEWFGIQTERAWRLFDFMLTADGQTIDNHNYEGFRDTILGILNEV